MTSHRGVAAARWRLTQIEASYLRKKALADRSCIGDELPSPGSKAQTPAGPRPRRKDVDREKRQCVAGLGQKKLFPKQGEGSPAERTPISK